MAAGSWRNKKKKKITEKLSLKLRCPFVLIGNLQEHSCFWQGQQKAYIFCSGTFRSGHEFWVISNVKNRNSLLKSCLISLDFVGLQGFYEHINGASILEFLKKFLTHEDPNMRAKTCSAVGNMCRHSSYFYGSLVSTDHRSIWNCGRNKWNYWGFTHDEPLRYE